MSDYAVKVNQGQIPIEDITVVVDTDHALVLKCDTRSKYAGDISIGYSQNGRWSVDLWAGHRTLDAMAGDPTEIKLTMNLHSEGWTVITDWRRYTVTIAAYREQAGGKRIIWKD